MLDVAIAGGGPGGLATALALRQAFADIRLKVFERVPQNKPQGASVTLHVNGVKAAQAIHPELAQRFRNKASTFCGSAVINNKEGQVVETVESLFDKTFTVFGVKPINLGWHEIRSELYDMLPEGTVDFASQVVGVSDKGDHAELAVRRAHEDGESVIKARVVVGTDGYYSRIREYCLADGPPSFKDKVIWRARIPWREGLPLNTSIWYRDGDNMITARLFFIMPCSANTVVWTASSPVSHLPSIGMDYDPVSRAARDTSLQDDYVQEDLIQRVRAVLSDFHEDVHSIVSATPPDSITEHGVFSRDAAALTDVWGKGCITLLGDAAHLTRPTGQGCNLALEDAVVLAHNMQKYGVNQQALRAYESERAPRLRKMMVFPDYLHTPEEAQFAYGVEFEPLHQVAGVMR